MVWKNKDEQKNCHKNNDLCIRVAILFVTFEVILFNSNYETMLMNKLNFRCGGVHVISTQIKKKILYLMEQMKIHLMKAKSFENINSRDKVFVFKKHSGLSNLF